MNFTDDFRWYSMETYPSQDWKIKAAIEHRLQELEQRESLRDIFIPIEYYESMDSRTTKVKVKFRKALPGYIFIHCRLTEQVYSCIKSVPGIVKFLGNPPNPIPESQVKELLVLLNKTTPLLTDEIKFKVGEKVRITNGTFMSVDGVVSKEGRDKVDVDISVFGRQVPVSIAVSDLQLLPPSEQ